MQNNRQDFDQVGLTKMVNSCQVILTKQLTLISLCSRNCRITFRRYSRLTSSSCFGDVGVGVGDGTRESEDEDTEVRVSDAADSDLEVQYPTPGLPVRGQS
jgi:hypothetical protein